MRAARVMDDAAVSGGVAVTSASGGAISNAAETPSNTIRRCKYRHHCSLPTNGSILSSDARQFSDWPNAADRRRPFAPLRHAACLRDFDCEPIGRFKFQPSVSM
jgi:hypothetical protein